MAKLIGHYFNKTSGKYRVVEIDNLKETEKLFSKTPETTNTFDHWSIMPKSQLNELKIWFGFVMYSLEENMPRFKELIIAHLKQELADKQKEYDNTLKTFEAAKKGDLND